MGAFEGGGVSTGSAGVEGMEESVSRSLIFRWDDSEINFKI